MSQSKSTKSTDISGNESNARASLERRRHSRSTAAGPSQLASRLGRLTCELLDLSYNGARVTCPKGLVPDIGELVRLGFVDGTSVVGRIAWLGSAEIGIQFNALVPDIHDRPDGTHLGKAYFTRILGRQKDRKNEG